MADQNDWALPIIRDFLYGGEASRPTVFVTAVRALLRANRIDDAEALSGEIVQRFPHDAPARVVWAQIAEQRHDWPTAAKRWRSVQEKDPSHLLGFLGLARALRSAGRLAEADDHFTDTLQRFPDDKAARAEWADCAQRRGVWPEALERWASYRDRFPDSVVGYTRPAGILRLLGEFAQAAPLLDRVRQLYPHDKNVLHATAALASAQEDWEAARKDFAEILAQSATDGSAAEGLAKALAHLGRHEDAQKIQQGLVA